VATTRLVAEEVPHPTVKVGATAQAWSRVILTGHAINVPFTAVTTGRKRTATGNATVAVSCAR
jgi:hypothetical protein